MWGVPLPVAWKLLELFLNSSATNCSKCLISYVLTSLLSCTGSTQSQLQEAGRGTHRTRTVCLPGWAPFLSLMSQQVPGRVEGSCLGCEMSWKEAGAYSHSLVKMSQIKVRFRQNKITGRILFLSYK